MKTIYKLTFARKLLVSFLALSIICAIAAISVRNTISFELANLSKLSNKINNNKSKPEQVLALMHQVDDDFQASILNFNHKKSTDYTRKLSMAIKEIDTLLKANTDTLDLSPAQSSRIKLWYLKKIKLSGDLLVLRHEFDSLLTIYANYNGGLNMKLDIYNKNIYKGTKIINNNSDTVQRAILVKKKGIFGRIKDAISNKYEASTSTEINHNKKTDVNILRAQQIFNQNKHSYLKQLQQLQQRNTKMLSLQKQLVGLNTRITNGLDNIIDNLKEINYNIVDELKNNALISYRETTALLNKLYLTAIFLTTIFAVFLIIFIIRLNKSEQLLRAENERCFAMAKQKMDLLLHMSHEIRNPLTAIKGFLYIFSKSNLSDKQQEMIDSIRLSSDMLLRTLNDTLDAAKMENSSLKLNYEPFNPNVTLKLVVESMEFSAAKKNLYLTYNFQGDKDTVVMGDSFRLKQIMINLISNAIKYTTSGGVIINSELDNNYELTVNIIDTGEGISLEQQPNLFSEYYQTNSARGKLGTGLGLFICKQLVELQKGKISIKSDKGCGSTFSFFIPYQRSDNDVIKPEIDDPLLLLNGITILAVDDNELNLVFLKAILDKWNMKFYQAANGRIALNIIARNTIDIVLTDLQMPEMDGFELLYRIRNFSDPLVSQLPVIAISGNTEPRNDKETLHEEFSGIISKPFKEAELMEQLVKVIYKTHIL